ncbi:MAG: thiamine phosphate synthase [Ruminococcus sp.]|nr:thiamine phosphate synthase [Ruminococcus sp.]MDE6679243.1 thiamine phosphate synthase [Ruminococcus sp.]
MNFNKDVFKLYAVTDRTHLNGKSLAEAVEKAIQGGVTCVQLREKNISYNEYISIAKEIREVCHNYGVPLIINDNYRVALASGADGVHVGIEDTAVSEIRENVGENFIIGATAKTVEQAVNAQADGADYLGVGAVFSSPTKTNAIRITPEKLKEICNSVNIPVVAIGGISLKNLHKIKDCGQSGIAVVSALFAQEDIKRSAERLREEL